MHHVIDRYSEPSRFGDLGPKDVRPVPSSRSLTCGGKLGGITKSAPRKKSLYCISFSKHSRLLRYGRLKLSNTGKSLKPFKHSPGNETRSCLSLNAPECFKLLHFTHIIGHVSQPTQHCWCNYQLTHECVFTNLQHPSRINLFLKKSKPCFSVSKFISSNECYSFTRN